MERKATAVLIVASEATSSTPNPNTMQILRFLTLLASMALLSAFAFMILVLSIPIFIIASPFLIPLGTFLFIAIIALGVVGGIFALAISAIAWLYNYINHHYDRHDRDRSLVQQIDGVYRRLFESFIGARDRTQDYGLGKAASGA